MVLEGLVVDSGWDMSSTGAVFQAPLVQYVDQAGATRRFTTRSGTTCKPAATLLAVVLLWSAS